MKTIILFIIGLFFFTADIFCQANVNNLNCEEVQNGTFRSKDGFLSNFFGPSYIIQRKNDLQFEVDSYGDKYLFDVEWLTGCSYQLTLREILNNPQNIEISDKPILVEIIEITENGYKNKITMDIQGSKVIRTHTLVRENPDLYPDFKEYIMGKN